MHVRLGVAPFQHQTKLQAQTRTGGMAVLTGWSVLALERMHASPEARLSGTDIRATAAPARAPDQIPSAPPPDGFPFEGELRPCFSGPV